jgi:hypothetical protein
MLRCEHAGFNEAVLRMFARRRCTRRERGRERERVNKLYINDRKGMMGSSETEDPRTG